jgi:hypothetical protein
MQTEENNSRIITVLEGLLSELKTGKKTKKRRERMSKSDSQKDFDKWFEEEAIPYIRQRPNERITIKELWKNTSKARVSIGGSDYEHINNTIDAKCPKDILVVRGQGKRPRTWLVFNAPIRGQMIRQHARVPVSPDKARIIEATKSTHETNFPHILGVPVDFKEILKSILDKVIKDKGEIKYIDAQYFGVESQSAYKTFVEDFLANSPKVASFFGVQNKFHIEGNGAHAIIRYG